MDNAIRTSMHNANDTGWVYLLILNIFNSSIQANCKCHYCEWSIMPACICIQGKSQFNKKMYQGILLDWLKIDNYNYDIYG